MDDLPEDCRLAEIAATSENCIGADCPRFNDCFVTKMRQRAAESDVVIVNHHLLCADASVRQSAFGEVIPSCRYAIVDEAHQLEDVATQYFGRAISNYRFDDFARDVDRAISTKQIPTRQADALARRHRQRARRRAPVLRHAADAALRQRAGGREPRPRHGAGARSAPRRTPRRWCARSRRSKRRSR
jgi:ATP-dependent DNA helicase DinG